MAEILRTAVEGFSLLEKTIRPSFGPRGIDVAVKTQAGSILLTNSGHLILNSLLMSHPVCRLVSQQVERHIGLTGDGSKEMVIVLSQFLERIHQHVFSSAKVNATLKLSGLSQACAYIVSNRMPKLSEILEGYCQYQTIPNENIPRFIRCILRTAIDGKAQGEASNILIDRTVDLILAKQNQEQKSLLKYINTLIDQFKDVCIITSGTSIVNTTIIDGFVIKQTSPGYVDSSKLGKPIKFIVIRDIFNAHSVEFGTTKLNCSHSHFSSFFESRMTILHKIVDILESNRITVILFNNGLPEHTRIYFERQFLIIQHVHDEDIERISKFFKIFPIETMGEVFSTDFSWHAGELSAVDQITIGRECYVRLCPSKHYENEYASCQLILCSPHHSITQQYYSIILDMLKVIKMCCYHTYGSEEGDSCSMKYLPSATCVEIIAAQYFATEAHNEPDMPLRTVCKSLSDAFLEIPKLIYKNSNRINGRFVDTQRLLEDVGREGEKDCCSSFGIDGETGDIIDPNKEGIIEPFSSKMLLVSHVLQTAQQILRIDSVLPARRIKS